MFTTVLLLEKPLSATDVAFLTGRHDDDMSYRAEYTPEAATNLPRAVDDVAFGGLIRRNIRRSRGRPTPPVLKLCAHSDAQEADEGS
ncbi:hypothetical protein [Nocardia sp. NPDC050793]|uniref:hypothetical protein n=1 Tax=Nocardia sp. NPDC050793 TaxID=3155159 RepID=UPI0034006E8B